MTLTPQEQRKITALVDSLGKSRRAVVVTIGLVEHDGSTKWEARWSGWSLELSHAFARLLAMALSSVLAAGDEAVNIEDSQPG